MAARRRRRGEGLHDARMAEGGMAEGVRLRLAEGQLLSAREMRTLRKAAAAEEAEAAEAARAGVELRYRKGV